MGSNDVTTHGYPAPESTLSVSTPSILSGGCPYCGDLYYHGAIRCPSVKAVEYHPNGTIKRIEFNR